MRGGGLRTGHPSGAPPRAATSTLVRGTLPQGVSVIMGQTRGDHDSPEDDPSTASSERPDEIVILLVNRRKGNETDKAWALRLLERMVGNAADLSACTFRSIQNDLEGAMGKPRGSLNPYCERDLGPAIAKHLRARQSREKAT